MKKILIIILVSLTIYTYAQEKKTYIGLSMGASIPVGDFASKNLDNTSAGFATTSSSFNLSFASKLGDGNFGLAGMIYSHFYDIDDNIWATAIATKEQTPSEVRWSVLNNGSWSVMGLMLGGFSSFPLSEKVSFDTRLMLGMGQTTSPEVAIRRSSPSESIWVKQSSASAIALSYSVGLGFRFNINDKISILTNIDYFGTNPSFNTELIDSKGKKEIKNFSYSLSSINPTVGIAIGL